LTSRKRTLDEYQQEACETAVYPAFMGIAYTALGLTGEAGEVAEKVKKMIRDSKSLEESRDGIIAELGDVLWYVAALAKEIDADLSTIATLNLRKLRDRKKRGTLKGEGDDR
jgi:NTP pyrophosphatase (non-canonical NTP hydrolase)